MKVIKKICNIRPALLLFVAVVVAILIVTLFLSNVFFAVILSLLLLSCLVFYLVRAIVGKNLTKIFTCIIIIAVSIIVLCTAIFTYATWEQDVTFGKNYKITATVAKVSSSGERTDVTFTDLQLDKEMRYGKAVFSIATADIFMYAVGDKLTFNANVFNNKLYANGVNAYAYKNDIRLRFTEGSRFAKIGYSFDLRHFLYGRVRALLSSNIDMPLAGIAFGMLSGDKDMLDSDTKNVYSVSGLAHILAVSGLHIGFIAMVMGFILGKIRIKKIIKIFILIAIFIMYAWFASFSVSVVRAVLMTILGLLIGYNGLRYDNVSVLSLAGTIILIFRPMSLFDVSYVLSMSAVAAIVLFAKSFSRAFSKKMPRRVAQALAVSTSVQIGIIPILLFYFGKFQIYSILVNLITLPLILVCFILLFVFVVISLVLPFMSFLFVVCGFLLSIIDYIARFAVSLPFSTITVAPPNAIILLSIVLLFFASRYVFNKKIRLTSTLLVTVLISFSFVNLFIPSTNGTIIPLSGISSGTVILSEGKYVFVGNPNSRTAAELSKNNIDKIEDILLFEISNSIADSVISIASKFSVSNVYLPDTTAVDGIYKLIDQGINVNKINGYDNFENYGIEIASIINSNTMYAYRLYFHEQKVLIINNEQFIQNISDKIINSTNLLVVQGIYKDIISDIKPIVFTQDIITRDRTYSYSFTNTLRYSLNSGEVYYDNSFRYQ